MIRTIAAVRVTITGLVLLAGVPLLLLAVGGSPLPAGTPSATQVQMWLDDPLQRRYLPGTARIVVWLFWALLATVIVAGWVRRVRRWRWARLTAYLPGPVQGLTATLLGATTVTTAVGITPAHAGSPAATSGTSSPGSAAAGDTGGHAPAANQGAPRGPAASNTVTVHRGDTLWDIAAARLGDPTSWKQIYRLNTDRYPRMRGGGHIEPGWKLTLPTRVRAPEHRRRTPAPGTTAPGPSGARTSPPAGADRSAPPAADATTTRAPDGTVTSRSAQPPSNHHDAPARRTPPPAARTKPTDGIDLPGGSWVDLGLAAAVAAAAGLVWAHRRRRHTPGPLSPDLRLDDPDVTPIPAFVNRIRRRLQDEPDPTDTDAHAARITPIRESATHTPHVSGAAPDDRPAPEDDEAPAVLDDGEAPSAPTTDAQVVRPVVPTLTNPAAAVWPPSGLGLTGPGAESAARGFLAAALADDDPDAAPCRAVLPSTTVATLLGAAAVTLPSTPRLIVTDDLAQAFDLLEQQILLRSRLVYTHEADTVAAMRAANPYEEPTPPLLLIADAAHHHERTRIAALLAQGQRLDVHGVLLGDWPAGDTVVVDSDGTTASGGSGGSHGQHLADVGRFAVLTTTETVAVITTLAEAHTGLPQPPPPTEAAPPHQNTAEPAEEEDAVDVVLPRNGAGRVLAALAEIGDATAAAIAAHLDLPYPAATATLVQCEHTGHAETIRTDTGQTLWRLTDTGRHALGTPATEPSAPTPAAPVADDLQDAVPQTGEVQAPTDNHYAEIETALQVSDPDTIVTSEHPPTPEQDADRGTGKPGHVAVTVLGQAGIVATDPDRRPRRKAVELLVYLAVRDGSATVEAILDDLMPEAPASRAPERLHTYVSDLRSVMRRIGGPATYLTHPHHRYTLNPDAVDVDLWRMRAAIREAHQADEPRQRIDALRQAVDSYRGPLADGADYEWAEPYREAIRQQALDAHLALADALAGDPAAQARILEAAIGHSPYSEHLYQRAMQARAALGHLDAIRTLRRALDRALAEIDAEPRDDTIALADELIADLQRPGRRTDTETTSGNS